MPRDRDIPHSTPDRNIFSYVTDMVKGVHERVDTIKDQQQIPTLPVYDSTNWPDEAGRGQLVRDINDPDALWVYAEDDAWHQIGGGTVSYLYLASAGNNIGTIVPSWDRILFDETSIETNDAALWGFLRSNYPAAGGDIQLIYPQRSGLYVALWTINWGSPEGAYKKVSHAPVQSFGIGFTTDWVSTASGPDDLDVIGTGVGFLGAPVSLFQGPNSPVAASGQIILAASHELGGGATPVSIEGELLVMRFST